MESNYSDDAFRFVCNVLEAYASKQYYWYNNDEIAANKLISKDEMIKGYLQYPYFAPENPAPNITDAKKNAFKSDRWYSVIFKRLKDTPLPKLQETVGTVDSKTGQEKPGKLPSQYRLAALLVVAYKLRKSKTLLIINPDGSFGAVSSLDDVFIFIDKDEKIPAGFNQNTYENDKYGIKFYVHEDVGIEQGLNEQSLTDDVALWNMALEVGGFKPLTPVVVRKPKPASSTKVVTAERLSDVPEQTGLFNSQGQILANKFRDKFVTEMSIKLQKECSIAKTKNKILENLRIAGGQIPASSKKESNVYKPQTNRLLMMNNNNASTIIGTISAKPFPWGTVNMAIDLSASKNAPTLQWFSEKDANLIGADIKIGRTVSNSLLREWIVTDVMPALWTEIVKIVESDIMGTSIAAFVPKNESESNDNSNNRTEKIINSAKNVEAKKVTVPAFKKTFDPLNEIGFTPKMALPLFTGEEEDISNTMKLISEQSEKTSQVILSINPEDAVRLREVKKNLADLFKIDNSTTIKHIREKYKINGEVVKTSTGTFLVQPEQMEEESESNSEGESDDEES